jgi:hypothetical protein
MNETQHEALFYKCPGSGFVSLSPGTCPKCQEMLVACRETESNIKSYRIGKAFPLGSESWLLADSTVSEYRQPIIAHSLSAGKVERVQGKRNV